MENHFHINIIEGDSEVVANIQGYIIDDPKIDDKALLLRGFNPTQKFLNSGISPDAFVESVFDMAKKFAQENNLNNIYITEQGEWHALSNRSSVFQALKPYMKKPIKYSVKVATDHTSPRIYEVFSRLSNKEDV